MWLLFHQLLGHFHGVVIGLLGGLFRLVEVGLGRVGGPLGGAFGLFGSFLGRLHRLVGIGARLFTRLLARSQELFRAGGGELLAALQKLREQTFLGQQRRRIERADGTDQVFVVFARLVAGDPIGRSRE